MSIISLTDARTWLRFPNPASPSTDDAVLQVVIDAAEEFIESKVGICTPKTFTEFRTAAGGSKIWLYHPPVLEVVSVRESWDVIGFELDYQQPDTGATIDGGVSDNAAPATKVWAYSLDVPETGEVTRRGPMNIALPFFPSDRGVRVVYRAGRNPMPAAIGLAARELVAHVWQNSQLRSVAQGLAYVQFDATTGLTRDMPDGAQMLWVGVPNRIITWIEAEMTPLPFIA